MRLDHKSAWRVGTIECPRWDTMEAKTPPIHALNSERRHPLRRRFLFRPSTLSLDVGDRFANGRDLLRIGVGDFDPKFLTQRELQLNHSNWVSTEVLRKARIHSYTVRRHAELRD